MHIWMIGCRFPPHTDAQSTQMAQLAVTLNGNNRGVEIFTTLPRTPHGHLLQDYMQAPFILREDGEPTVFRHWSFGGNARSKFGPWLIDLSFAMMLLRHLWRSPAQKPDVIWYSFPPVFTAFAAKLLALRYKAQLVLDVHELWAEQMQADGRIAKPQAVNMVNKIFKGFLSLSTRVIVSNAGMRNMLSPRVKKDTKIHILPPTVSTETLAEARQNQDPAALEQLRIHLNIGPLQKVVMYLGHHGVEQDLIQFLKMARLMEKRTDLTFLLVGEGPEKDRLKQIATPLKNTKFAPMPEAEDVWTYYGLASVCVLTQATWAAEYILPARIAETFAAGRPLVVAGGADLTAMAQSAGAEAVAAGDVQKMAYAVLRMLDDEAAAKNCSASLLAYAENYSRLEQHLPKLVSFLEGRDG